jgi:uncharacterized membrane protein
MTDEVLFDTVLRPAPPLSARALLIILAAVAAINVLFASYFILRGAWPVMPFMGLDVALLGWAFRASRKAAKREEHVVLTASRLSVLRRPSMQETVLNPYWVRVDDALTLWSHGKGVPIGAFLPLPEREPVARRLRAAVRIARFGS